MDCFAGAVRGCHGDLDACGDRHAEASRRRRGGVTDPATGVNLIHFEGR
ncbi:hypothetical protein SSAG_03581 [Streptomyces sp. Mg1]|nr:hypothetical protein SSAG_03581 [Streptomyces sp. Mg1]